MVPLIRSLLSNTSAGHYVARSLIRASRHCYHSHNRVFPNCSHLRPKGQLCNAESKKISCLRTNFRTLTFGSDSLICERLTQRGVVRISGVDTNTFLQGLVTNDMSLFDSVEDRSPADAIYAMMLNVQGRVLYDLLIYQLKEETTTTYLVECDAEVIPEFLKVLKRYKIRKKVTIADVSDEYTVFAAFTSGKSLTSSLDLDIQKVKENGGICLPDPRLDLLGHRILTRDPDSVDSQHGSLTYKEKRYQLGVSEGLIDLPPGASLPLESNAVFLNGVSFNKGCYIGQELTARSHHTGVIRKRLMPLLMSSDTPTCEAGDTVENAAGKNCGKFRDSVGKHGLGLLRIQDVIGKGDLSVIRKVGDSTSVVGQAQTFIPDWWPRDSDEIVKQVLAALEK